MDSTQPYWSARPMGYGGKQLDFGEVVTLGGLPNDEALVRLGYLREADKKNVDRLPRCGKCGRRFIDESKLNIHGQQAHSGRPEPRTADEYDRQESEREEVYQAVAPLLLDKTSGVKPGKRGRR